PGFTISTAACQHYLREGHIPPALEAQVKDALALLESRTGKKFGGTENPLLLSVRSGAAISMPGMMETILNLGSNDRTIVALAAAANDERFAYDSYRRFIQLYSSVVLRVSHDAFERRLESLKRSRGVKKDTDLT